MLRDILANRMPDILYKQVYALSAIAGGLVMTVLMHITGEERISSFAGLLTVIILRCLAERYHWNLPRIS